MAPVHPPRVTTAVFALRWITDQIIRSQPGSYVLPHPDGGELWVCPFGSGKSAHRVDAGAGIVQTSQFVEVTSADGVPRKYEVVVQIKEIPHERSEADHDGTADGELPEAVRAERPDPGPVAEDRS